MEKNPSTTNFYFALPQDPLRVYRVSIVHLRNSYDYTDNLFFDHCSLSSLVGQGPYVGEYKTADFAYKLVQMTLEIQNRRMLGLFGKILAFLTSLSGAILIVTGLVFRFKLRWKRNGLKK